MEKEEEEEEEKEEEKEEASRSDNVGKLCGCTEGRGSNSVLSS